MGRILKDYPDISGAVMDLIVQWYPEEFDRPEDDWRVGRHWPNNVQDIVAAGGVVCRVQDIGGNDDGLTDRPLIDIDILAPTWVKARDIAKGIQTHLLGTPWRINGTVLDRAKTAMRPHEVPWDDNTFRFYASYVVTARR